MSKFKGTKGKWEYSSDNSWECSVVTDNDSQSITLENADSESDEGFYEMYNNAKLIACAPEMLEMLEIIIKENNIGIVKGIDSLRIKELIKKATE